MMEGDLHEQVFIPDESSPPEEKSHKDIFWGAVSDETGVLVGENVLGKLLMKIRRDIKEGRLSGNRKINFNNIRELVLFGEDANSLV